MLRRRCYGLFVLCGICGEQVAASLFSFAVRCCSGRVSLANALNGGCISATGTGGLVATVSGSHIRTYWTTGTTACTGTVATWAAITAWATWATLFFRTWSFHGWQIVAAQSKTNFLV